MGLVSVYNRPAGDCGNVWLYGTSSCIEQNIKGARGEFLGPSTGYAITVSDVPCSASSGCPSGAAVTVCDEFGSR